jgi:protein O-mannosyl-transferase
VDTKIGSVTVRAASRLSVKRSIAEDDSVTQLPRHFWNIVLLLLCFVSTSLYLPSLTSEFIHDDHYQIVNNPQIKSWDYLSRLLTSDVWSQKGAEHVGHYYRPLFSIWMLVVYTLGGLDSWFWHLSSIWLHVVATYLVYRLCSIFVRSVVAASFGAALYAVHPIHVDAVAWVSASNELLFTTFTLAALLYLEKGASEKKPLWVVLSLGFYGAALLSKETAVAVLPLFPIVSWLATGGRGGNCDIRRKRTALRMGAIYALPATLYLIVRSLVLEGTGAEAGKHSWTELLCSSPSLVMFYLKKLLWPVGLAGFYVNPLISLPTSQAWLIVAALLVVIGLVVWVYRGFSLVFALIGGLILFPLLPVLVGIRIYDQGNMTHDRYLYLPSVGLCLLAGLGFGKAWHNVPARSVLAATGTAVLVFFSYLTVRQQRFYRDDEAFYQRAITIDPTNALVMGYLGDAYLERNENDKAMEWFERAVETAPNDPNAEFYLARGLMKTHQYAAAEPYLRVLAYETRQISFRRKSAILLSLANAELQLNQPDRAKQTLQDLNVFNSTFPGLHRTLGIVFQREGQIEHAQKEYALEFQISGDRESGNEALALARYLAGGDAASQR